MIWLISIGALFALGWVTNSWVLSHGLAVLTPTDHWEMGGEGWHGVGSILIAGLVVGLVAGLFIGSGFAHLIASWVTSKDKAAQGELIKKTLALAARETTISDAMLAANERGQRAGIELVEASEKERLEAVRREKGLEWLVANYKKRLAGAQSKSASLEGKLKKLEQKNTTDEG